MGALLKSHPDIRHQPPASLEDKLVWLTKFGKPSLFRISNGFYASVEMHVSAKGTTFKIDSDSNFESPTAAVDQCIARMLRTLSELKS